MIQTLFLSLLTALWTIGLNRATAEGYVLERPARICLRLFGAFWSKPLLACPACMCSLHGAAIVVLWHLHHPCIHSAWWVAAQAIAVIPVASALVYLLDNLIDVMDAYASQHFEPEKLEP